VPITVPTAFAWLPLEFSVPSKFASPPMPLAGSMNPVAAMFMLLILTVFSNGVLEVSLTLIGPAFPEMSKVPPLRVFALT
jgi:hypothetical protein